MHSPDAPRNHRPVVRWPLRRHPPLAAHTIPEFPDSPWDEPVDPEFDAIDVDELRRDVAFDRQREPEDGDG